MSDLLFNNFKFFTLVDLLCYKALHQPNKIAFRFLQDGETEIARLTYQELNLQAQIIASQLQSTGITKGERALLLYPSGLEFIPAFFGCLYAGVVAVPAYPPHLNKPTPRLQAIVADAQAKVILTTAQILSNSSCLLGNNPELKGLQCFATDSFTGALENNWQEVSVAEDTLAFLQYTSGSTSTPKGVMVSHGNLLHNQRLIKSGFGHNEQSIVVGWLPLFHDMGLIGNVLQPLYLGTQCILMPPVAFLQNPFRWLQAISRYKATTSGGPNFAYDLCIRKITPEQRATLDLSTWEVAFNGAEPVRAETIENFAETFASCGFRREAFYPCYGMAETTLIVSGGRQEMSPVFQTVEKAALEKNQVIPATLEDDAAQIWVSSGQPLEDLRVVIAHPETLTSCLPSEVGEIWVSGASVTQGYWQRSEQTESTFRAYLKDTGDGPFLRTGDLGFLHSGELYVTGRLKDMIIIRGRNHYPQDIELTVEQSHPALQSSCSGAFAIDVAGEERLAVVVEVKRSQLRNFDVQEVVKAIRQAVAEQHELQVYAVELLKPANIPKTSSGKIQRHACRIGFLNHDLDVVGSSILEESSVVALFDSPKRENLLSMASTDRQRQLEIYLQQLVAQVMQLKTSQLNIQQPLSTVGLDSLMAVELKNSIETELGVVLSMTSFLQGDSIAQIASQVLKQLTENTSSPESAITPVQYSDSEQPLSYGQRSLWFMHQLAPASPAYNVAIKVRLKGDVEIAALQRAFQKLVDRHPALRTTFTARQGEPRQLVHQQMDVCFQQHHVSSWSKILLQERLTQEVDRPFNLEQDALMRVSLFTSSAREHILLLVLHHIITDFWSLAVMVQELGRLYQAEKQGYSLALPPLKLQYIDYSHKQAQMLASSKGEQLGAYWQQQLAGELPGLNLPTDRPRPPVQTYRGYSISFKLSTELTQKLKTLSCTQGTTLYMTLLAAYQLLLHRYTGQEDILVGSPTVSRSEAEFAGLLGYFVNPVVLRSNLAGNLTFENFLGQVRQTVLDAFTHQDYPLALLVERLQTVRDSSRSPLFQTMFVWQKAHLLHEQGLTAFALNETGAHLDLGELKIESLALEQKVAQFDLTLMMAEVDRQLAGTFEYNADLFNPDTITRMASHFQTLLERIVANPQQCLSILPLLTAAARQQLLGEWNATQTDYPQDVCLHELFEAQVEMTPDAIAVIFQDKQLTYQELNQRANQLAHHLQANGVKAEVGVGIYLERSLEMAIGVLGVLKAGGTYVPCDPMYPKQRISFMLADAQVKVLLTQHSLVTSLPEYPDSVICLDTDWEIINQQSTEKLTTAVTPANLAYIIYTSGSSGQPKGVMIPHAGIVNHLVWGIERYQLTPKDRVFQKTSFSFDVCVWEFFAALLSGACLVMADANGHQDPSYMVQVMAQQQITIVEFVPAMLQMILEEPDLEACQALRHITCGGEALPKKLCDRFFNRLFEVELHNCYGPTEVSISCTSWLCQPHSEVISIGRPIANQQIYILDAYLQPLPIGVPGELYVGGVGIARGYLNRPETTAEKFIPHPFSNEPGARLYKTGDLARYLPDGNIEFLGRLDEQVKIRGFRLELGEIEAVLRQYPGVEEVAVLVQNHIDCEASHKHLVAYLVPRERHQKIEFWPSIGEYPLYDELLYHAMTNDLERNQQYQYAINELVRDRIVVEIGTGQDAILARLCVAAGAEKVYAIEGDEEAYNRAVALVKRLGLAEKIILIHSYSQRVELPSKADVCISEIIGTIGGSEGVTTILNDARRFLKEDACMIPHRCITKIAAVTLPDELQANPGFNQMAGHYVQQIFAHAGHPFDLRMCIKNFPQGNFISDSDIFEDLDFTDVTDTEYSRKITLKIINSGRFDGFLLWLNLYPAPNVLIDNLEQENSNWLPVYLPVFTPGIIVSPGEIIEATCISQLSDNHVNPDYRIAGQLIRQNGEIISFVCDSLHHQQTDSRNPLYEILFPQGEVNLYKDNQQLSAKSLRSYLSRHLPDYMIPSAFVTILEMPRKPNGKLDYRALPELDATSLDPAVIYVPPSTALEEVLAGIWSEILQVERVGIHDNFFELGGHSLLAIQVISRIRDIFNVELPVHNLFEASTVAKLSQILMAGETKLGQIEKIAQVFQKITAMSIKDLQTTLQQKRGITDVESLKKLNKPEHLVASGGVTECSMLTISKLEESVSSREIYDSVAIPNGDISVLYHTGSKTKLDARVLFVGDRSLWSNLASQFLSDIFAEVDSFFWQRSEVYPSCIEEWEGDYIISFKSDLILPQSVLEKAKKYALNIHPAPPNYRGIGGYYYAVFNGDITYGVTCHHMVRKIDFGDIIKVIYFPILPFEKPLLLKERTGNFCLTLLYEIVVEYIALGKILPKSKEQWFQELFTYKKLENFFEKLKREPEKYHNII
ncbi:MAG: amino acid adenylation domain-containing protein [Nostoc sp. NMS7]|uniref:non-ribosomal peptide synthetase n=1 Tax=Nostoc sp. NMS7 TaxID=2815391 RepID=UPI0025E5BDB5|nr:non-ribosomal peptide synthetase [Nostoc sp. NMS7]MBN3950382.1 amino acid adenylation domain-containing protein [Nostoc sp. NMS7]